MVVFHDAEGMVDPAALGLLDEGIAFGADFVQLPVEPLVQHHGLREVRGWLRRHIGSHYCQEFAEAHGKAMVVRDRLRAGLPGAGVGCTVSRCALDRLAASRSDGLPFTTDSLTEDYKLGLAVASDGGSCCFVRARGEDGRLIATRAFFPDRFDTVVRQKSRWVLGIALQGFGWSDGVIETWMLSCDRRGPLTALVLLAGYALVMLTGLMGLAILAGLGELVPLTVLLNALLIANLAAFVWRAVMRSLCLCRARMWSGRRRCRGRAPAAGQWHRDHRRTPRGVRLCPHARREGGGVGQDRTPGASAQPRADVRSARAMTRAEMRASVQARGTPLAMMDLLLTIWIGGRAAVWESPFPAPADLIPAALAPIAEAPSTPRQSMSEQIASRAPGGAAPARIAVSAQARGARSDGTFALLGSGFAVGMDPRFAAAHQYLWHTAMRTQLTPPARLAAFGGGAAGDDPPCFAPAPAQQAQVGRWSLDAWGFWRQGSDSAPISQGRVPIYGASQIGAVLNYRLAPDNARDPRVFVRAYQALVRRGESEVALGASARPLPRVPVRLFGELRYTRSAFRSEARPAAYAVTELAPLALPFGTRLEAYAQGGWVGGTDDTLFADGQASLTREIGQVAEATDNELRFSLGAGAWGGAQEGAHRFDLGPTMRLDVTLGAVPARVSLDWRERVEGDAGPGSGTAMTLSTRF
jgi:hypothetical protein